MMVGQLEALYKDRVDLFTVRGLEMEELVMSAHT